MKIKGIIREELMTLPELRDELLTIESARLEKGKEMSYEFRKSIEHANQLSHSSRDKSKELVEILQKQEKISPEVAYRLVNTTPKTKDEVRAIFTKDKYAHTAEEIDAIIELILTHY